MNRIGRTIPAATFSLGMALGAANAGSAYMKTLGLNSAWNVNISSVATQGVSHYIDNVQKVRYSDGATYIKRASQHPGGKTATVSTNGLLSSASAHGVRPRASCPV